MNRTNRATSDPASFPRMPLFLLVLTAAAIVTYNQVWLESLTRVLSFFRLGAAEALPFVFLGLGVGMDMIRGVKGRTGFAFFSRTHMAVAAYGIATFFGLSALDGSPALDPLFALPWWAFEAAKLAILAALLAPPAAALGATVYIAMDAYQGPSRASLAAVVAGTLASSYLTGSWLIPLFEFSGAMELGALVGLTAALLAERSRSRHGPTRTERRVDTGKPINIYSVISGFVLLAGTVTWSRMLLVLVEDTILGRSSVLIAAAAGASVGSLLVSRACKNKRCNAHWAPLLLAAGGGSLMVVLPLLDTVQAAAASTAAHSGAGAQLVRITVCSAILGPASALLWSGLVTAVSDMDSPASKLLPGWLLGAGAGTALVSVIGLSILGFDLTLRALAIGAAVVSAGAYVALARPPLKSLVIFTLILGVPAFAVPRQDISRLLWVMAPTPKGAWPVAMESAIRHQDRSSKETLLVREGGASVVSLRRTRPGRTALFVDGLSAAWMESDGSCHIRSSDSLASITAGLLHPSMKRAMLIGSATPGPVRILGSLDAADIDIVVPYSAVLELQGEFGGRLGLHGNGVHYLHGSPRYELSTAAARGACYDAVIMEVQTPWLSRSATLLTREAFDIVERVLEPGGLLVIRLFLGRMDEASFRSIARSMAEVFPQAIAFHLPKELSAVLVACKDSFDIDVELALAKAARINGQWPRATPGSAFSAFSELMAHAISSWTYRQGVIFPPDPANTDSNGFAEVRMANLPKWQPLPLGAMSPVFGRAIFDPAYLSRRDTDRHARLLIESILDLEPSPDLVISNTIVKRASRMFASIKYSMHPATRRYIEARLELAAGRPGSAVSILEGLAVKESELEARKEAILGAALLLDGSEEDAAIHLEKSKSLSTAGHGIGWLEGMLRGTASGD